MKKLFLSLSLIICPILSIAGGPVYSHKEPATQQEFINVYQDMRSLKISSSTLPGGSTQYIQNRDTLQSGATSYSDFQYVGSSSTVFGNVEIRKDQNGATRVLIKNLNTGTAGLSRLEFENSINTFDIDLFGIGNTSTFDGITLSSYTRIRNGSTLAGMIIANGGAFPIILGTNDVSVMRLSGAGEITQPLQPSFLATQPNAQDNITGDNTHVTINFPTEIYDQGGDFSNSTFTAPVNGRYYLSVNVAIKGIAAAHTFKELQIVTSNRIYAYDFSNSIISDFQNIHLCVIADMDAGDIAYGDLSVFGSTKVIDIIASGVYTQFSGSLIN